MGSCIGREEIEAANHLIIDVQKIIADDAWSEFVFTSRRKCNLKRLAKKRSDYTIEVPMNYYHFQKTEQTFNRITRLPGLQDNDVTAASRQAKRQGLLPSALKDGSHPDQMGLKTKFKNDTNKDQKYNFRFEKSRRATVEVTYQKGFSIGGNAHFSIGLPQVLPDGELGGEINMSYEVTNSRGQTFEEIITTEATSEIIVSRHSRCTANVIMEERRLLAEFTARVIMSMPIGQAVVFIKNKHGRTVFLKCIENLSMLFPDENHIVDKDGDTREDAVQFQIKGVIDGMQLANHYIHLKGRKLPKTTTSSSTKDLDKTPDVPAKVQKDFSDVELSDDSV